MTRSLVAILNEGNPNKVPNALAELPAGQAFTLIPKHYKGAVASNVLVLPEAAKAVALIYALKATGTDPTWAAPVLPNATLATDQARVGPTGNIEFFATDAVTAAEVIYLAADGYVREDEILVVAGTGIGTLDTDAFLILSATVTEGTALGAKTVVPRTTAAPSAGQVGLNMNGTTVNFAVADAVTRATVRYIARAAVTVNASLQKQLNW